MSLSDKGKYAYQAAKEQAMAEVLKEFLPQLFSSPTELTQGAPDSGDQDVWMLTNIPADVLVPLSGLKLIGEHDNRPEVLAFVNLILRGVKGINGFTVKQGEHIAVGLGGGGARKVVKRPGVIGRNITNRGWHEKAEDEGAEIVE
jgi:hypothetical protein